MRAPAFYAVFVEFMNQDGYVMVWDTERAFATYTEAEAEAVKRRDGHVAPNGRPPVAVVYRCTPVEADRG